MRDDNIEELINEVIAPSTFEALGHRTKEWFTVAIVSLFYSLWRARNERIFKGKMDAKKVIKFFESMVNENYGATRRIDMERQNKVARVEQWLPPQQ